MRQPLIITVTDDGKGKHQSWECDAGERVASWEGYYDFQIHSYGGTEHEARQNLLVKAREMFCSLLESLDCDDLKPPTT